MKTIIFYFSLFLTTIITSCSSDQEVIIQNNKQLKLSFNSNGQNLKDLNVSIFESENDFLNNQVLESRVTDINGSVLFENLGQNKYYWKVETSCIDNLSLNNTVNNLSNELTEFNILVENNRTGTIIINNNSSYEYQYSVINTLSNPVYGNVFPPGIIESNSNLNYSNIAIGQLHLYFIKHDGFNQIDTFIRSVNLNCGETTTINLD